MLAFVHPRICANIIHHTDASIHAYSTGYIATFIDEYSNGSLDAFIDSSCVCCIRLILSISIIVALQTYPSI
jgi:hypothetical protein